jgi:phage/plasmid-associated DNA primase
MSEAMKDEIASEANTCLQWIYDKNIKVENVIGMTKEEMYDDYVKWCDRNGYSRTAMGSGTVAAQIGTIFRLKLSGTGHRGTGATRRTVRVFVKR